MSRRTKLAALFRMQFITMADFDSAVECVKSARQRAQADEQQEPPAAVAAVAGPSQATQQRGKKRRLDQITSDGNFILFREEISIENFERQMMICHGVVKEALRGIEVVMNFDTARLSSPPSASNAAKRAYIAIKGEEAWADLYGRAKGRV